MRRAHVFAVAVVVACFGGASASATGCSSEPAATPSTETIGPDGGTLQVGEVTLTIPKGALAVATSITVTKTTDPAPSGFAALSPLYRFEPTGLTFAAPATVSFAQPTGAPTATIVWSTGATFDAIPTQATGGRLVAAITHFSSGFVSAIPSSDAGTDADASADGDSSADAASDASIDVNLDASACFTAPAIDPPTIFPGAGASFPLGFGCAGGGTPYAVPFGVTKPSVVSFAVTHHNTQNVPSIQLRQGCDANSTLIVAYGYDDANHTAAVGPGLYTLVNCEGPGWAGASLLPPSLPIDANTSCNGAFALPHMEANPILDGNPRYYKWSVTSGPQLLQLTNVVRAAGRFTVEVQAQCGNPSSDVLAPTAGTFSAPNAQTSVGVTIPAFGTYTIILSNLDPGVQPKL